MKLVDRTIYKNTITRFDKDNHEKTYVYETINTSRSILEKGSRVRTKSEIAKKIINDLKNVPADKIYEIYNHLMSTLPDEFKDLIRVNTYKDPRVLYYRNAIFKYLRRVDDEELKDFHKLY